MKKKTALLGASGSIGRNAAEVMRNLKDHVEPVLFSTHNNIECLLDLKKEFPNAYCALTNNEQKEKIEGIDYYGSEGLLEAIASSSAQISINGISGAAGLLPSIAILKAGSHLALANKESIVMAGSLLFSLAKEKGLSIIPVDSEHMALFKLIHAHGRENISEIILTASGGPFRNYSMEELKNVIPENAMAHPTWKMGQKISIDSASLANKGLEVIEAAHYFDLPPEKIKVSIHPQSIVHSMVKLHDGAVYAQMSKPDMKLTIHEALTWPQTHYSPFGDLDFESLTLNFEKPDFDKFPMLNLAYKSLEGNGLPCVYNAANEIAVEAFVDGRISFLEIPSIVSYVLREELFKDDEEAKNMNLEKILIQDNKARKYAEELIKLGAANVDF